MREGGRERKEGRDGGWDEGREGGIEGWVGWGEGGEIRGEMKEIKVDKFL